MRLKRLVARGFKSFADRTEFEFDNRLTGIIGPNGCGKSNVVDAIKWVLGDQRAKSLRGNEMTDVIFKGAEGRDAMSMAEVTISFEDPTGSFDGRTEIDISRRLTIDKESSYLVNGQEVRLKDVRDVLLDTGLGTGGYSVMEQGRIDAVLSANPEARRAIFEEAAGIARFKLQKKEALRKLDRTDQNLARVTDLLEERSRRIRSLRIQAGKARRFQELQAALRDLRAAVAVIDGTQLRELQAQQEQLLLDQEQVLAHVESMRDEAMQRVRASDGTIARCEQALETVRNELSRCESELLTHRERADAQQQRATELASDAERGKQRGRVLAEQQQERMASLAEVRDGLAQREQALIDLHKDLAAQRQAVSAAQQELRRQSEVRETIRQQQLALLHARTKRRNVAVDQQAKLESARARQSRLLDRMAKLLTESAELCQQRSTASSEIAEIHTRERILREREQLAFVDLRDADVAAVDLATQESALRNELSQVEGRRTALIDMEAHFEGLDAAPRYLLQSKPAGLRGRLLDLLEIDLAYSSALEAALGQYVQALVVDTRANATAIILDLQERRLGRVLLLVEEDFTSAPETGLLLGLPTGAQRLLDLVRSPSASNSSSHLLAWLLRGVVMVESLAGVDSSRADLCFVTKAGSLSCGPRIEGGASAEGHSGLVVRRSQIQELSICAGLVEARLQELIGGKELAVSRVERLKLELRQLGESLQLQRRSGQTIEAQLARVTARGGDVQREISELEDESAALRFVLSGALAVLGQVLFDQHFLARKETELQVVEESISELIREGQSVFDAASNREQELRLLQAKATEAREGLLRTIRVHEDALREIDQGLDELADRVQQSLTGSERAAAEHARLQELAMVVGEQLVVLQELRDQRQAEVDEARATRDRENLLLLDCEDRRRIGAESLSRLRLQLADSGHRFARLEERLREETGVELLRCLGEIHGIGMVHDANMQGPPAPMGLVEVLQGPPLPPRVVSEWLMISRLWLLDSFQPSEAKKEVQVLQSQKDRLGAVNLDAVLELDQEEGQFTSLEQEVGDLKDARRSLMETLRKLEVESRGLFEQTFSEARKNFQEIFRKLFQGGKADMFLGESEDLLEAGIEIVAQPPGKQLQSINLLSGGERSLTAVAILFALFKVRPSPFCILDEVDAALDETNVERFLRVLRDFTTDTQFCIVTHHKRTMAECQVLYGITMQRRGVSSRIAVSMQQVDGFAEPVTEMVAAVQGLSDPARKQLIAGEEQVGF
ncbi:MAG: chromosome segregation protein SMC [Planctomycetes bacterium]|nr:chromosome segregation protein SMC [Planctomycetota bacterium]